LWSWVFIDLQIYHTYIRWSTSADEWCVAHRFAGYRDLHISVTSRDDPDLKPAGEKQLRINETRVGGCLHVQMTELGVTATAPFPPTYSKSKFGIQLTARELEDRRAMVKVFARIVAARQVCARTWGTEFNIAVLDV
jgi:hypothetical protein